MLLGDGEESGQDGRGLGGHEDTSHTGERGCVLGACHLRQNVEHRSMGAAGDVRAHGPRGLLPNPAKPGGAGAPGGGPGPLGWVGGWQRSPDTGLGAEGGAWRPPCPHSGPQQPRVQGQQSEGEQVRRGRTQRGRTPAAGKWEWEALVKEHSGTFRHDGRQEAWHREQDNAEKNHRMERQQGGRGQKN